MLSLCAEFDANDPTTAEEMLHTYAAAAQYASAFMAKLRKYLRRQRNGDGTFKLIKELMAMCAAGKVTSRQLAAGIQNALRGHERALRAFPPVLAQIHQLVNVVRRCRCRCCCWRMRLQHGTM